MYFIAHNIKFLREKHKLSINDIADKTSIPKSTIASYAEGRARNPSEENVKKLAALFQVDPLDLVHKNIARFPVSEKITKGVLDGNENLLNSSRTKHLLIGGGLNMSSVISMSIADLLQLQKQQSDPETIKALQEVITFKKQCEFLQTQIDMLMAQLNDKERIISSKEQLIAVYQSRK